MPQGAAPVAGFPAPAPAIVAPDAAGRRGKPPHCRRRDDRRAARARPEPHRRNHSAARRDSRLDAPGTRTLAERLASISAAQAGAERIASTPLPYAYSLLIYRTAYLYGLLLPLALVGPAGWLVPLFVVIAGYVFPGLAEVAEDLAQSFGPTANALPQDAICRMIEISMAPHPGELPAPPLEPRNYVLT